MGDKSPKKKEKKKKKGREKDLRERKKYLKHLEATIEAKEEEKEGLNQALTTEEVFTDIKKSYEISEEIGLLEEELKDLYEEWETLLATEEDA